VINADRTIELLRKTVTIDDLPRPYEMPIEALAPSSRISADYGQSRTRASS
jgi:hypothetical protein